MSKALPLTIDAEILLDPVTSRHSPVDNSFPESTSTITTATTVVNTATNIQRSCKRKRVTPITPPASPEDPSSSRIVDRAVNVLATEAVALSYITRLYQTDPSARTALLRAVECVVECNGSGGKLIICGVGKSGYVGMKVVATMKSLGIGCSFLHAAEAIHGDLGDVRANDVVLFITFSGKTAELVRAVQHISEDVTIMALTAHIDASTCPLLKDRLDSILLPAPIPESEESTFGVSAPTTSTTVAMALGDMLALSVADRIHQDKAGAVFRRNHPGGSIGERI